MPVKNLISKRSSIAAKVAEGKVLSMYEGFCGLSRTLVLRKYVLDLLGAHQVIERAKMLHLRQQVYNANERRSYRLPDCPNDLKNAPVGA